MTLSEVEDSVLFLSIKIVIFDTGCNFGSLSCCRISLGTEQKSLWWCCIIFKFLNIWSAWHFCTELCVCVLLLWCVAADREINEFQQWPAWSVSKVCTHYIQRNPDHNHYRSQNNSSSWLEADTHSNPPMNQPHSIHRCTAPSLQSSRTGAASHSAHHTSPSCWWRHSIWTG